MPVADDHKVNEIISRLGEQERGNASVQEEIYQLIQAERHNPGEPWCLRELLAAHDNCVAVRNAIENVIERLVNSTKED